MQVGSHSLFDADWGNFLVHIARSIALLLEVDFAANQHRIRPKVAKRTREKRGINRPVGVMHLSHTFRSLCLSGYVQLRAAGLTHRRPSLFFHRRHRHLLRYYGRFQFSRVGASLALPLHEVSQGKCTGYDMAQTVHRYHPCSALLLVRWRQCCHQRCLLWDLTPAACRMRRALAWESFMPSHPVIVTRGLRSLSLARRVV